MNWVKRHKFWVSVIVLLITFIVVLGNSTNLYLATGLMSALIGYIIVGQITRLLLRAFLRREANNADKPR